MSSSWAHISRRLLNMQDMDLMVKTVMAIEREVDDTQNIRDASVKNK